MTNQPTELVLRPISVAIPSHGVALVESVHGGKFRMDARKDDFYKIIFVVRGRISVACDGTQAVAGGEGSFFAVDPSRTHRIRDLSPSTLFLLCMQSGFLDQSPARRELWTHLAKVSGQNVRHDPSTPNAAFERIWRIALLEQNAAPIGHTVKIGACADQILVFLARLRKGDRSDRPSERVASVIAELHASFHDPWSIDRASAQAGLSRHYFTRLFRQAVGMSFLEKLTALRLDHAAILLRQGGHSIAGVAFACGFSDLSHFYRVFRARFGAPPGKWMMMNQSGQR